MNCCNFKGIASFLAKVYFDSCSFLFVCWMVALIVHCKLELRRFGFWGARARGQPEAHTFVPWH